MFTPRRWFLALAAVLLLLPVVAQTARAEFPLKDGDIWVMAGDSITDQRLHSNYFEAFCYARYPKMKFGFRNSGVGGHTIPSTLARFDYDIAAWKPTVVSVELGMNDQGGTPTDKFMANMDTWVKRVRGIGARPVIFSASPINNGQMIATLPKGTAGNTRLEEYARELKTFAAKENIPYADQFHRLLDPWGRNYPSVKMADTLNTLKALAMNDKLAGVEHLREFIAAQQKNPPKGVNLQGDPVHPGAPGQLSMAAALLKELDANPFVSSATINVGAKTADTKDCIIENLSIADGKISFDRLDERLPFPIPDEARVVTTIDPTIYEMSQYTLKVAGLKPGNYELKIDGGTLGTVTAKDLEAGINLTTFGSDAKTKNAIAIQGKAILKAVSDRVGLVYKFRGESKAAHAKDAPADAMTKLAATNKLVLEGDDRIREAATPKKMKFEVIAVQ